MSYDYQTDYTGSPISTITGYTQVGTPPPINSNTVTQYVSYVATIPPVNGTIFSPVVNTGVQVVSPLMSNIYYFGTTNSTPYDFDRNYLSFEERNSSETNSSVNINVSSNDLANKYTLVGYNTSPTTKPCGRDNKAGWYGIHEKHVFMVSRKQASVILCGDSIIAGLSRYSMVWNKHFRPLNAINCGIGGDRTQHVLWRMENMKLPSTVKYIVVHCGTNNIDRDSAQEIANGVVSCGLVLQENNPELNIVITGLLPRDLENSRRRYKIIETNKCLKQYCRQFPKFSYMKQDKDWVLDNGLLNQQFYYDDNLHLVESGNDKFATSIINIINKLSNNEEIDYSSDEESAIIKFERVQGEIRQDTPTSEPRVESPLKVERKSDVVKQKRKRSSPLVDPVSGESTSHHKRRRTEHDTNCKERIKADDCSSDVAGTPKKHADNHKVKKVIRKDYFSLEKEIHEKDKEKVLNTEEVIVISDEPLEGTVKSIDISLTDGDRQEARKAKFGSNLSDGTANIKIKSESSKSRGKKSNTLAPSALVMKIKRSMEQARQELSKKKLEVSLQGYDSHGDSSQGESTPPNTSIKKLISDYGSSESE